MSSSSFSTIADQVKDLREFSSQTVKRIPWGIKTLDLLTYGPAAGEVYVILGRSETGKSALVLNVMANNTDKGMIFFSLEMPVRQALMRLYAIWSGTSHHLVFDHMMNDTLPEDMDEMAEEFKRHVLIDHSNLTVDEMSAYLQAYEGYFGERPKAVLIDYLEQVGGAKDSGDGGSRVTSLASQVKNWSKDEDMAVYLVHQSNMSRESWEMPLDSSARFGGYTEADVMVGLWQPARDPEMPTALKEQKDNELLLTVMKNRTVGRKNPHPIKCILRSDLRIVDQSIVEAAD